jgi:signal transduction histidine kinase
VDTLRRVSSTAQRVTGNRRAVAAELGRRRAEKVLFRALDVVSHDLRSPLFAVQLGVKLLERQHGSSEEIAAIQRTVQTATRIIQRLVHAGRQRLEPPSVPPAGDGADLREAWARAVEVERRLFPAAAVSGEVPEELWVAVAPAVVSQLCGVLLDNALRHSRGKGALKVTATTTDTSVHFELRNPGQLPFADSDRIEAFEYRSNGGLGLGLFNARRMALACGATVQVRQEGLEVVAVVVLPAGEPAAERQLAVVS